MKTAESVQYLQSLRKDLLDATKGFAAHKKAKDWTSNLSKVKSWLAKRDRTKAIEENRADQADQPEGPPVYQRLLQIKDSLAEQLAAAGTGSIFEAKAGVRGIKVVPKCGTDPVAEVQKVAYTKQLQKELASTLKHHDWGTSSYSDTKKTKKVMKILQDAFDPCLFSQLALPAHDSHPWTAKVYELQLMGMPRFWINVGATHLACMEARMLFDGEETLYGIPPENVPGDSLKDKRLWLLRATVNELLEAVKAGWCLHHDAGEIAIIPTGFIVIALAKETRGIWWCMSVDARDTQRCQHMLGELLNSFPELRGPQLGYSGFHDYLCSD